MKYASGEVAARTTTGNQSVTGIGFKPQVLKLSVITRSADGIPGAGVNFGMSIGITDGTNTRCGYFFITNNANPTASFGGVDSSNIIKLLSASTPTNDLVASFVSFDADGFTINVGTAATATAWEIQYEVWGNVSNVAVGTWNPSSGTGSKSLTGLGFKPDVLMWVNQYGGSTSATLGEGATSGSGADYGTFGVSKTGLTTGNPVAYWHKASSILVMTDGAVASQDATLTSFDTDGWTYNFATRANTTDQFLYLAIKGGQWKTGSDTTPGSVTTKKTSGLTFQPLGVMFFGVLTSTGTTINTSAPSWSTGSAPGLNTGRGQTGQVNSIIGQTVVCAEAAAAVYGINGAGTSVTQQANISAWDNTSFTLNYTTSATVKEFGYVAFASPSLVFNGLRMARNTLLRR